MAIKTIEYKISVSGITPSVEQFAGIQGDHCATKISISIDDELYGLIMRNFGNSNLLYRFDVYDGEGGIWQSEPKELAKNVQIVLEERHTRHGGKITVYLVITVLSEENQTEMELYSFPCVLRLKNRPDGEYQDGESYESVSALVTKAGSYATEAREFANEVVEKLKNGEFDGKDGVSVTHSFDGTVLKMTSASGTTMVDLKGEKGDKGESGKDAVTDKSYSPQSENAQSGKAVAEAVSGFVPKIIIDDLNAPFSSVLAVDNCDFLVDYPDGYRTGEPNDSSYHYIRVHDTDYAGTDVESMYSYANMLAQHDRNGNLATGTPIDERDCANKKYVDGFVKKVKGNTMTDQAYAVDPAGNAVTVEIEDNTMYKSGAYNFPQRIPRRNANGNLYTGDPIENLDCVNKKYVDDLVSNLSGLKLVVVSTLPNIGDADTLYFVPSTLTLDQNLYDEYIYTNGSWERIGSAAVEVDLTGYVKKTDVASGTSAGVVRLKSSEGIWLNGEVLTINQANKSRVDSRENKYPIVPSMLDYAVKVGLTTNTETLTDEEKAQAQSWLGIEKGSGDNWELINKITTTEDVKRIMCTTDSNGNEFLLKKVVFIVRSQPSANADGSVPMYYLVSTFKTRDSTSTVHQIGELTAGLRTTAQENCAYVEQECYIPSGRVNGYGLVHFHIVGGGGSETNPKYQQRDIIPTRDEEHITCAYVESGSDTTIFGAGSELEIWGVRA